jgi:hypothetical protein
MSSTKKTHRFTSESVSALIYFQMLIKEQLPHIEFTFKLVEEENTLEVRCSRTSFRLINGSIKQTASSMKGIITNLV